MESEVKLHLPFFEYQAEVGSCEPGLTGVTETNLPRIN